MRLTPQDNDTLTRSGPDTPMGRVLRQYWTPAIRSSALEADGAPVRIRLFGEDFVAFRATDGQVGFLDEGCPHRGVSLALGRNEENGLRCIFHGWKMDAGGKVVDAPCEPAERRQRFAANIRINRYSVREAAGVVWVFIGKGAPPDFPEFEFMNLPPEQVYVRRAVLPYNWVQGLEAHIDGSHVPILHSGFLRTKSGQILDEAFRSDALLTLNDTAPKFEVRLQPYGLQEIVIRNLENGTSYARVREVVLPFYTFIPGPNEGPFMARVSVPIDDETSAEWYISYDPYKPLTESGLRTLFHNTADDPDDFAANLGTRDNLFNQDRAAMKEGHWSGFPNNFPFEDFIAQAGMGPRVDRSKEQLGSADVAIARVREILLAAARRAVDDQEPGMWASGFDYRSIRSTVVTYGPGGNWQDACSALRASRANPVVDTK